MLKGKEGCVVYGVPQTMLRHWLRHWRNLADVQSSFFGDTMFCSGAEIGVGTGDDPGYNVKKVSLWFLDRRSAAVFCVPGMWETWMDISNSAWMNHKHSSRCITMLSFENPFWIASTKLRLSHWNSVWVLVSRGPQTTQLNTIGTSSFAMIDMSAHEADHEWCSHWEPKCAPQPQ